MPLSEPQPVYLIYPYNNHNYQFVQNYQFARNGIEINKIAKMTNVSKLPFEKMTNMINLTVLTS